MKINTSLAENRTRINRVTFEKRKSQRLKRVVINAVVANVVPLLFTIKIEISSTGSPQAAPRGPWSSVRLIESFACIGAGIALLVSFQTGNFAKSLSLHRRGFLTAIAILSPAIVLWRKDVEPRINVNERK